MNPIKRCYICHRHGIPLKPMLMTGIAGYRRYQLCAKCEKDVKAESDAKKQPAGRVV